MDEKTIRIIPFTDKREKMAYVAGKIHVKIRNQGIPCPTNR